MSVQVKYMDVPQGAQVTARATTTACQSFGWEENLTEGASDIPWATLEADSWKLDGTRQILPDRPFVGWWSINRSGADGRFGEVPGIRIDFPENFTATGITFDFWPALDDWCSEISVAWYIGDVLLQQVTAFPNAAHWILEQVTEDFDRIEIRLLATNSPGRFAKIRQITIGQIAVFGEDELVQVRLLREVDPSLCQLPVDTLSVAIRDRKNRKIFPQRNQIMQLYQDGILLASHFIADSSRDGQRDYRFRCQSSIGRLEGIHRGGIVHSTVQTQLDNILWNVPYVMDPSFKDMPLQGYLPVCTRREALQQIAFAIGAVVSTHADGTICLQPMVEQLQGDFTDERIFTGAKLTKKAPVAQIQLMAHSYMPGEKRETLLNGEIINGKDVTYLFSKPYDAYEITGGTLNSYGENWVSITANGGVTLTAIPYIHTTATYTKTNTQAEAQRWGNTVVVKDATLVNSQNAPEILERLYRYHSLQNLLQQQVVVSGQQIGQLVRSANPWDTATEGYLIRMESDYIGSSQTADITIRGKEVQRI